MVLGQRPEVPPTAIGAAAPARAEEEPSGRRMEDGTAMTNRPEPPPPLTADALRWIEHIHVLEYVLRSVPRRTAGVAAALAMLDRDLPMGSRDIAAFARVGHETVRRAADALFELSLIDRHRRPLVHARADIADS